MPDLFLPVVDFRLPVFGETEVRALFAPLPALLVFVQSDAPFERSDPLSQRLTSTHAILRHYSLVGRRSQFSRSGRSNAFSLPKLVSGAIDFSHLTEQPVEAHA